MRKLVNGQVVSVKDDNGAYLPSHATPPPADDSPKDPPKAEINLDNLMDSHLLLLFRETRALLIESAKGEKLSKDSSQAMRENMKLIMELKKKEKELLETLTDDEIAKMIEAKLDETKKS